jgi:hypothetical protein
VGIVEFDLTQEPTLTFRLIDIYGNQVWQPFVITAAELKNGVKTWDQKMDGGFKKTLSIRTGWQGLLRTLIIHSVD